MKLIRRLLVSLFLGALVLLLFALYADVRALGAAMVGFPLEVVPIALLLAFANYLVRFVKWHAYVRILRLPVPPGPSFLIFLSGLLLSVTPGKLGELLKSALLKESFDVPVTTSAPIVFAERLTDFLALILLTLVGVATLGHGTGVVTGAAAVSGGIVLFLASERLSRWAIRLVGRLPGGTGVAAKLGLLYESAIQLIRPWPLVWTTVVSACAWFCECVAFFFVLNALPDTACDLGRATFIYAFATIFGAVTMLPGGLFATEGSMVGMLQSVFRLVPDRAAATTVTLVIRFCTLWFAVVVGGVAFSVYRIRRRRLGAVDR